MIKNIAVIEEKLGIEKGKLAEMVTSDEEHEVNLEELVIRSKADDSTFIENLKRETGKAAVEVAVKRAVEKAKEKGIEIKAKDVDTLIEVSMAVGEEKAKVEPNTQIETLKKEKKEALDKVTELNNEVSTLKTTYQQEKKQIQKITEFTKHVPSNALISPETIYKEAETQGYVIDEEEGQFVVKDKTGNIIKDANLSPIPVKDFVSTFVTPFVPKEDGGGGGGDDPSKGGGGKAGSLEAFEKEAEKENWSMEKKNEVMAQRIADKTLTI